MLRRTLAFVLVCLVLTAGTAYASAPNDQGWSLQWHLRTIHADRAWTKSKGAGVVVAVVDTGVDLSHPDLQGRLVSGRDFVDPGTPPDDAQGHGTFMAGLIAADTGNVTGVASVAPLAKIMPVRVLDANGIGKPSDVAAGINWAVQQGAEIINLSLAVEPQGSGASSGDNLFGDPTLNAAINDAANAGRLVVIAAGNNFKTGGASSTSYKTSNPGVLVVGASTRADRRAAYSNYGDGLDVLAPGGGSASDPSAAACQSNDPVVSTWWNKANGRAGYGAGCGTSMGVAHVAGIAALLMARGYSNTSAVSRIERTAVDLYSRGPDAQSGWGRVDAAAAVGAISVSDPATRIRPRGNPNARTNPRTVGAAGTKPSVRGTKILATRGDTPIKDLALTSAIPFHPPRDPKLRLVALSLALCVGAAVANTVARRPYASR